MDKGKAVMGSGRRWAVDFTDNSTLPSSRDIPDPPGFSRASQEQDDSAVAKQKKDAEANWKAQLMLYSWVVGKGKKKGVTLRMLLWVGGFDCVNICVDDNNDLEGCLVRLWLSEKRVKGKSFLSVMEKKAWEVAQAPFKNLLMMGFMMWMAGNTVHLFSIGITFSALWQPIGALQGVGKVFEPYKDSKVDLLVPKLVFIALNLGGLALGIWKLNTLGLLPTHASDWVSSLPPAKDQEPYYYSFACLFFRRSNIHVVVFLCSNVLPLDHSPSVGKKTGWNKELPKAGPDLDLFLAGGLLFVGVVAMDNEPFRLF
ncbi:hypothetical protein SADUNF_Sadunf06G0215200 [Salix dunnii]|uniref:ER membrane protein complex subunit 4 n=1 Tax=Salix dunnii TaxID=1413687 RepID=A0A835MY68_9ROSI|nr:hypothetical protein SADUNF_Sadunf06G0215200 [Salix dunnii]